MPQGGRKGGIAIIDVNLNTNGLNSRAILQADRKEDGAVTQESEHLLCLPYLP